MMVRVYYADTDALGIVYHANYLRYFEMDRTEYMRDKNYGVQFVVVNINIQYHKPARLHDELQLTNKIKNIGHASIVFEQYIHNAANNQLLCEAEIKLVTVNKEMRPVAVPAELKLEINK